MPFAILPILQWLIGSKLGRQVLMGLAGALLVIAAVVSFKVYIHNVRTQAKAEIVAEMKAAEAAEHTRRDKVLQDTLARADQADREVAGLQHNNEKLKDEIKRLSAAHDNQPCLDAGSVQRLRSLGQPAGH